ncbi:hypothetical protein [Stutzerimonas nitrititolerans]|uniref:hypothetical protein n=1 Tax=Stutzerimonas nitrititolerans TaxID=2482751 RepID=UPI0028A588C8|nr:hypothetical protein [Stutzerimonas nitrititolerans]
MPSSESDIKDLPGLRQFRNRTVQEFFDEHPDVMGVCDTLYFVGEAMPLLEAAGASRIPSSTWCNLLWQQAADYLSDAFFLFVEGRLDSGFALLRMAAELARDTAVLRSFPAREHLWRNREAMRNEYRRAFRFDTNSPLGLAAQAVYKFGSQHGVHGHTTNFLHFVEDATVNPGRNLTSFKVSKIGILKGISFWMRSFAPVHGLCAASRSGSGPEIYTAPEVYQTFQETVFNLGPVLESLEIWLAEAKNEAQS